MIKLQIMKGVRRHPIGSWEWILDTLRPPARHWSPGSTHLRFWPFVLTIPRRIMPHRDDKIGRCPVCREDRFIESGSFWCEDCKFLHSQIQRLISGDPWWQHTLHQVLGREEFTNIPGSRK